jgi:hypothetical protein
MSHSGTPAGAILDAWRVQGAARLNPVRFHYMEALQQRAARLHGEARRLLEERLSLLIQAYAEDLEKSAPPNAQVDIAATPPARSALGELADYLANRTTARGDDLASFPQLDMLDDFRKLWSRLRTESQLRQSLEQVPTNAGPLNSGNLVHRSITLMRELSPGYLQQFLAYVDALTWIEQMNNGGALVVQEAPRAVGSKKRARCKPRER